MNLGKPNCSLAQSRVGWWVVSRGWAGVPGARRVGGELPASVGGGSPWWLASGFWTQGAGVMCRECSALSELAVKCSLWGARSFPWRPTPPTLPSPAMASCLSCGSKPSPGVTLSCLSTPQPLAYCCHPPRHGSLLPSPLGCLHTANPNPLPGTDPWSLSLSSQPPSEHLRLWCLCQWFR